MVAFVAFFVAPAVVEGAVLLFFWVVALPLEDAAGSCSGLLANNSTRDLAFRIVAAGDRGCGRDSGLLKFEASDLLQGMLSSVSSEDT